MNRNRLRSLLIVAAALLGAPAAARGQVLVFSADTEGHVAPCTTCPGHPGLGGLARRGAAVAQLREQAAPLLLLDAGDFLVGAESLDSRGRVMVSAYDALRYDAVNLAHCDFRLGKAETLKMLSVAKFDLVSCNLLDAAGGGPLVKPYVVKKVGDRRVAILGATEVPAGLDFLPHLKGQLAGIHIRPPVDALAEWLPKAKADADDVVLLYHGSPRGVRSIRQKCGGDVTAILVAGLRQEQVPIGESPPVIATSDHGRHLGWVTLGDGPAAAKVEQVALDDSVQADPEMLKLLARFAPPHEVPAPIPEKPTEVAAAPEDEKPAEPATAGPRTLVRPKVEALKPAPSETKAAPPELAAGDPPALPMEREDKPAEAAKPRKPATVAPRKPEKKQEEAPKRVAAKQPHEPRGLPGVGLTPERVNESIDRGADFLWAHVKAECVDDGHPLGFDTEHVVACLALVHAGAHERHPDFDAELRKFIARIGPDQYRSLTPGYWLGVYCMLIDAYGDPQFMPQLTHAARYLLESQLADGSWTYNVTLPKSAFAEPADGNALKVTGGRPLDGSADRQPPWKRRTPWRDDESGDNSVSQFSLLGLNAASRAGIKVPPEAWKRNLALYRGRQDPDGGWAYSKPQASYGSMACAGICGVVVNRHELGEPDPAADEAVERGLAWLAANFAVDHNPGHRHGWHHYYLYSVERVGQFLGTEFIGPHEWYPLGARQLVNSQQSDGSWDTNDSHSATLPTSFALLFLKRATPSLRPDLPRGGEGLLKTAASAPAGRVHIILDCSGSMLVEMDGRPKFEAARDAVAQLVEALPAGTRVGLRVYGHRKNAREEGADEDTQLLLKPAKLKKAEFLARLKSLRARGKTPLARSLTEALADLDDAGPKDPVTVVLLTDGGEDTQARPRADPVKPAAEYANRPGVSLHVVGFDINRPDWTQQLKDIAAAAGGRYWPAERGDVLARNLRAAVMRVPDRFVVLDADDGAEAARGRFGESKKLKEGKYRLRATFAGRAFEQELWVNTNATTAVTFDAAAVPAGEAGAPAAGGGAVNGAGGGADNQTDRAAKPPARRFCTRCGKPVARAARFCASCGAAAK